MPVDLQTTGQRFPLASAEVSSGTGASTAQPEQQQMLPADLSPEARAALARLTGGTPPPAVTPAPLPPTSQPAALKLPARVAPNSKRVTADEPREIADNLTVAAHSLTDPNETRLARGLFTVDGVAFDIPMLPAADATATRQVVRLSLHNVVMPDGTEVARGNGRATLLVSNGKVIGMLEGSVSYDASTTYLQRGDGTALSGHRGQPGRLISGAAAVRDGRAVGLAANSVIDIDGIRISSGDDEVDYRFTPPDLYTLTAGATVLATPADRAIRVAGTGVSVVRGDVTTRLGEASSARIGRGSSTIEVDGTAETYRQLADPAPTADHAKDVARGAIVLRRIPGAQLYIDGIKSSDLDQIGAGDCYFIAPLIGLAEMTPEEIERLITDNHDGTYTVHFMGNDGPVDIIVDDDFYMSARIGDRPWYREKTGDLAQYSNTLTSMVYAANPAEPREIWGAIIEKAYAKWKGGYGAIYGGYPDIALRELTGRLSDTTTHANSTAAAVFADLQRALSSRSPTFAITEQPATPDTQAAVDAAFRRDYGMRNSHVYVVIDTAVDNGVPFVILRNTERLIEGRSSEYQADVDRDGDGKPDGQDGYFRLRMDDYYRRFVMTTTLSRSRRFVPGTTQVPYAPRPIGQR